MVTMTAREWLEDPSKGIARMTRPQQLRLTDIAEDIFLSEKGGIAFVEAPTGCGKSFAYLTPALLSGKRVIVSTAKKTLQHQLRDKDLPFLTGKLFAEGPKPPYALLKGKANYVCKLRAEEFLAHQAHTHTKATVDAFAAWIRGQPGTDPVADLSVMGNLGFEYAVRVQECIQAKCPHRSNCGYRDVRVAAGFAKVLVVNHALLAYDLQMGGGKILGAALVLDEAHQFPGYAEKAFSLQISGRQADTLERLLDGSPVVSPDSLKWSYDAVFKALPTQSATVALDPRLTAALNSLQDDLQSLKGQLSRFVKIDGDSEGVTTADDSNYTSEDEATARAHGKLTVAATIVTRAMSAISILFGESKVTADYLPFVERRGRDVELILTPIDVGAMIAPALLGVGRVVATSATLATSNHFQLSCRKFGLNPNQLKYQEILGSPFPYEKLSALYVNPTPDPAGLDKHGTLALRAAESHELLQASRGGGFVLCASNEDMNGIFDLLMARPGRHYEMARQVQTVNVEALLEWFKSNPTHVLLGVKTLWEGVDVQGLGLRVVIIPRIPFPNRGDIMLQARKDRYIRRKVENGTAMRSAEIQSFTDFDLQEALMDLKQGGGRLIRSETDMGVVALLDPRAAGGAKQYSGTVRAAFPHPQTYDKAGILGFLKVLADRAIG
jgi:ATP-dependent DNA helicase DinG